VIQHRELMEIYILIFRADLAIEKKYASKKEPPIAISVTTIYGSGEEEAL
jgi:surfactin synthase thioesterase subunit